MSVPTETEILAITVGLWQIRESLDVDLVDGEFYWRLCRADLVSRMKELVHREGGVPRSIEQLQQVFDHFYQMESLIPGFSSWINHELPPRMRDPLVYWTRDGLVQLPVFGGGRYVADKGGWVILGVRNSRWRGRDVEAAFRSEVERYRKLDSEWLQQSESVHRDRSSVCLVVDYSFCEAGDLSFRSQMAGLTMDLTTGDDRYVTVESPVILCKTQYPLPPNGFISTSFDEIVVNQKGWHRRLYGANAKDQGVDVAIRTWAIGLLVAGGAIWGEAQTKVESLLNTPISQAGFTVDRAHLVARVPEAEPFVFQRKRGRT